MSSFLDQEGGHLDDVRDLRCELRLRRVVYVREDRQSGLGLDGGERAHHSHVSFGELPKKQPIIVRLGKSVQLTFTKKFTVWSA